MAPRVGRSRNICAAHKRVLTLAVGIATTLPESAKAANAPLSQDLMRCAVSDVGGMGSRASKRTQH